MYVQPEPEDVAVSHDNLGKWLTRGDPAEWLAHRLAAAILRWRTTGLSDQRLAQVARDLHSAGESAVPASFAQLQARVQQVEGVRFGQLWAALAPDPGTGDNTLTQVLQAAHHLPDDTQAHLDWWEPLIATITAAAHGDTDAAAAVGSLLAQLADQPYWATLAGVLRRILAGDRDQNLLAGLDPIGTAIATQVLDRLSNHPPTHHKPGIGMTDDPIPPTSPTVNNRQNLVQRLKTFRRRQQS